MADVTKMSDVAYGPLISRNFINIIINVFWSLNMYLYFWINIVLIKFAKKDIFLCCKKSYNYSTDQTQPNKKVNPN